MQYLEQVTKINLFATTRKKQWTVQEIFQDNHNWDTFCYHERGNIREVEYQEVNKMLTCRDESRGFLICYCHNCMEGVTVYFGCNSRICSYCGKNYTDKWASELAGKMFDVVHRHIVMTVSDKLWQLMKENRELLKVLMDAAITAINDTLKYHLRTDVMAGAIVVLHPFGRDLSVKPHIHVLMTEGGFDGRGHFHPLRFIPAKSLRKTWQYQVLTRFKEALPKTKENALLIDRLFKEYGEGFYVRLPAESRITHKCQIAKYIGRYIRHPAIANYRIEGYDGKTVTIWYRDNQDVKHYKTMEVFDFIRAIIQHIPDRQFKMIRYYGAYCRKWKGKYSTYVERESITRAALRPFTGKRQFRCPKCGSSLEILRFSKEDFEKPPPKAHILICYTP